MSLIAQPLQFIDFQRFTVQWQAKMPCHWCHFPHRVTSVTSEKQAHYTGKCWYSSVYNIRAMSAMGLRYLNHFLNSYHQAVGAIPCGCPCGHNTGWTQVTPTLCTRDSSLHFVPFWMTRQCEMIGDGPPNDIQSKNCSTTWETFWKLFINWCFRRIVLIEKTGDGWRRIWKSWWRVG